MRVIATQVGFFVKLRRPGDQFEIRDELFSAQWMKRVAEPKAEVVLPPEPEVQAETPAPVVKKRRGRKPKPVSE